MSRLLRPARLAFFLALAVPLTACDALRAEFYFYRGAAQYDEGQLDEAIASFRKAIELQPDYAGAHNNLGAALHDKGQLDEAIISYRKAIELQPDYAEAHNNLGVALREAGQEEEAQRQLDEARRLGYKPEE